MSGGLDALSLREDDVKKFLVCGTHLGATNMDFQMEQYVYKRKTDGTICLYIRAVPNSDFFVICMNMNIELLLVVEYDNEHGY